MKKLPSRTVQDPAAQKNFEGLEKIFSGGDPALLKDGNLPMSNSSSIPTTGPAIYVQSGALKYRGSNGKITILAQA